MSDTNKFDSLGDRLKYYESKTTTDYLEPDLPLYVRIDGRAFHTLCRGMDKPFDKSFTQLMQETCSYLVEETGANLGYVQSDEISLGWTAVNKCPFGGRLFKINSVLASMASAYFMKKTMEFRPCISSKVAEKIVKIIPTFDCRAFTVPSKEELVNCFIWRQNDCTKNCISSIASTLYSVRELNKKNSQEKIKMINEKSDKKYEDYESEYRLGTFYHRVMELRPVTSEALEFIPENQRVLNDDGEVCVVRTRIDRFEIPVRIAQISNRIGFLFDGEEMILKEEIK